MDPVTAIKIWTIIKPIKRLKQRRARKKAEKLREAGVIDLRPDEITDDQVEAEVKEFLVRKAKGALKSSTFGVASLIITAGVWLQTHPEALSALIPDGYEGVALALVGLAVAIARLRTAGK